MRKLCHIAMITAVAAAAVLAIGINRIVVTDGHIPAGAAQVQAGYAVAMPFKSDYFPLER